jgi:glycosyltransferase involved in cell wall biosynthesis
MWKPSVSVIVPVYNTEKYLRKCLDSLADQTLKDIEIIIIDDGSTDSSPVIIKEYTEKDSKRFISLAQENSGQAVARNKALKMCTGEYIGFLDSDDFVRTDMFERMYNAAVAEDADYVACGYTDITYDETGNEIELEHYVHSKLAYKTKDMFFGALASPFLHLYKKEVLIESGADFPEGVVYEDTAFYLNIIPYIKKLAVIDEPLAYRVRRSNSTMSTFKAAKVRQIFKVLDYSLDYYKKKGFYEEYQKEMEYFCVRVLLCSSMQRICKVEDSKERKALQNETLDYLYRNFPNRKSNKYFKGGFQHLYMKTFNKLTAPFYAWLLRKKARREREYI